MEVVPKGTAFFVFIRLKCPVGTHWYVGKELII